MTTLFFALSFLTSLPAVAGSFFHDSKSIKINFNPTLRLDNSQECQSAFLNTLVVTSVTTFPTITGKDICSLTSAQIPAPIHSVIAQIKDLNTKAAAALGKDAKTLYDTGLDIQITGNAEGPFSSSEAEDTVMPDWDGKSLEAPIYVHELGHVLADGRLSEVWAVKQVDTFVESFADLLSASTLNVRAMITDPNLPACMQVTRSFSPQKSFHDPIEDFTGYGELKQYIDCCDRVDLKTANEITVATCQPFLERKDKFNAYYAKAESDLKKPFDPTRVRYSFVDHHAFAEPINSFLFELSAAVGTPALTLMLNAVEKYGHDFHQKIWTCQVADLTVGAVAVDGDDSSYMAALQSIRVSLTPKQQIEFDRLWQLHGMEMGNVLDVLGDGQHMRKFAARTFTPYLLAHGCDKAANFDSEDCEILCL